MKYPVQQAPRPKAEARGSRVVRAIRQRVGVFVTGCPPHGIEITNRAWDMGALGIDKHVVHRAITELHNVGKGTSA